MMYEKYYYHFIYFIFRRIFNPLVALEADYDKKAKEALSCPVGQVRWDIGLNKKVNATFQLPEFRDGSMFYFYYIIFNNQPRIE